MNPLTQMLALLIVLASLALATVAALHDARQENDALHIALVDSTLKRRALVEWRNDTRIRHQASTDLLRACRDKLALRDAKHDSRIVELAIRGAEYYDTTTGQYAQAAQE